MNLFCNFRFPTSFLINDFPISQFITKIRSVPYGLQGTHIRVQTVIDVRALWVKIKGPPAVSSLSTSLYSAFFFIFYVYGTLWFHISYVFVFLYWFRDPCKHLLVMWVRLSEYIFMFYKNYYNKLFVCSIIILFICSSHRDMIALAVMITVLCY